MTVNTAQLRRELGAETRVRRTVKRLMLDYRDWLARKLSMQQRYEIGIASTRAEREMGNATAALIMQCIAPTHPADETITSERMLEALPLRGQRLLYLVAWYENTYGNGEDLARHWNPCGKNPRWAFVRWCKITERVLQHRFLAAGLLEEE